jgi:hypothetical protein
MHAELKDTLRWKQYQLYTLASRVLYSISVVLAHHPEDLEAATTFKKLIHNLKNAL